MHLVVLAALAVAAAGKPHVPHVMVLDLPATQGISTDALQALNAFTAGAVRDQGFEVVTAQQIRAVLGLERQKQLLGCAESSCLAELGGALGVDDIVMGSVAVLSHASALTLTVVNQKGIAVGSQRELVQDTSVEGLIAAVERLVPKLMAPLRPDVARPKLTPSAESVAPPPAGGLTASASASGSSPVGPYVLLGTGAAALAASVVVGVLAKSASNEYQTGFAKPQDQSSATSKTHNLALVSTVLTGAGIAAAGSGAVWWAVRGPTEPSPP